MYNDPNNPNNQNPDPNGGQQDMIAQLRHLLNQQSAGNFPPFHQQQQHLNLAIAMMQQQPFFNQQLAHQLGQQQLHGFPPNLLQGVAPLQLAPQQQPLQLHMQQQQQQHQQPPPQPQHTPQPPHQHSPALHQLPPQVYVPQPTPPPPPSASQPGRVSSQFVESFIAQEEAIAAPRAPRAPSPPPPPRPPPAQITIPVVHMPSPIPPVQQPAPLQPIIPMPAPVQAPAQAPVQAPPPPVAQPAQHAAPGPVEEPRRRRGGGGRKRKPPVEAPPRVDEALAYLRVIKQTFAEDVPVYHRFLEIMKDFRAQRIDTPVVIEQVAELLYASPDLVLGFNTFLPAGFRIAFTEDRQHFVFTSPLSQPKILASPEERAQAARAAANAANSVEPPGNNEAAAVAVESAGELSEGGEDGEDGDDEHMLEEEVIRLEHDEEMVEEEEDGKEEEEDAMVKLVNVLKSCFVARPSRLVEFVAFMETLMSYTSYYAMQRNCTEPKEEEEGEGTSAPKETVNISTMKSAHREHLTLLLASVCEGEPQLLAACLDFFPYFNEVIVEAGVESDAILRKILDILEYPADGVTLDVARADSELQRMLQKHRVGASFGERLRISTRNADNEAEELMVLERTNRVIYEHLKKLATPIQLKNLLTLMSMYTNLDITAEDFLGELPRIMGARGSQAELLMKRMLGMERTPTEKAESDPDAVMKCDVPIQKQKRGLREQKTLEQVKVEPGATVCTLGPSYRLMVKEKDTCEGRREMNSMLKEVLNDTWTSYPSWSSEEAGTTTTKKSNLEEFHYKTEDERYELDIIVDSNRTIIEQLNRALRHINSLPEEQRPGALDDKLNCSSKATFVRVMTKVYTNQVYSVIEAARKNPKVGLTKIIEGLKEKDEIWSKFQQETNRTWRDVLDKTLSVNLNVLNNQQKMYDQKALKSKFIVASIEAQHEERKRIDPYDMRPDEVFEFTSEKRIYRDTNDVTAQFFADLPGGKHEKDRSKIVLFRVLMEWFCQPQQNVEINTGSTETFTFQGDEAADENLLALLSLDGANVASGAHDTFSILSPTGPALTRTERFQQDLHHLPRRYFYGDDNVFMIVKFHQLIAERFTKILAAQAVLNQEYVESQAKHRRWQQGAGSEMRGQKVLEENVRIRQEAVNDIRNTRSCPSSYYEQTLHEMKSLGNGQIDIVAFEEAVKLLFPGDVVLFSLIDKLFTSFAKNIHHATCADSKENAIKLYLKYRRRLDDCRHDDDELTKVLAEYAGDADEVFSNCKNMYRFEFVAEPNAPYCNVWLIPRSDKASEKDEKEKEMEDDEEDEDDQPTSSGGNDDNTEESEAPGDYEKPSTPSQDEDFDRTL